MKNEYTNNQTHSEALLWDQQSIRTLRMRLGWSQAEFARRLSLDPADIEFMENGILKPSTSLRGELEIIMRQAEECCQEKRQFAQQDADTQDRL